MRRPSQRAGSRCKALQEGHEGSGDLPEDREALPEDQEAFLPGGVGDHPEGWDRSGNGGLGCWMMGGYFGGTGGVGRPSRWGGSSR